MSFGIMAPRSLYSSSLPLFPTFLVIQTRNYIVVLGFLLFYTCNAQYLHFLVTLPAEHLLHQPQAWFQAWLSPA
jgi:hypothetical protein